jgi:SOS-response transcriptional repressor LexA
VPAAGLVQAPLISWVEAGGLTDTVDAYPPGEAAEWVPVFHRHDQLIALTVKGQSMDKIAPAKPQRPKANTWGDTTPGA